MTLRNLVTAIRGDGSSAGFPAQRSELGLPQLPAGHRPLPLITDSESFAEAFTFKIG